MGGWRVACRDMGVPRDLGDVLPEALARHEDWGVRLEAALDPGTLPESLICLSRDEHEYVRAGVAANPSAPAGVLAGLAADTSPEVRASVAGNPAAATDLLVVLARDGDALVRASAAGNVSTPPEILGRLAQDPDAGVREQAAGNSSSPAGTLTVLASDGRWEVRRRAAGETSAPVDALARLAGDRKWEVRHAVAANPSCAPDTLRLLAGDKSWKVRQRVASALRYRHLTGGEVPGAAVLERLAADEQWQVRCEVARHPGAPPQVLAGLAEDISERVRQVVAGNRAAPPDVLAALAADGNWGVSGAAAHNPETPPRALAGLLDQSRPWSRAGAVTGIGRHVLGSVLAELLPAGLALLRTPRVRRREASRFLGPLVPDLAVTGPDALPQPYGLLDPAMVRLAVEIVPPGQGSADNPALLSPHAEAGFAHVWRAEVDGDPVICVFRLEQGSYQLVTSARPGQLLAISEPFPVTVDLTGLQQRLAQWLTPASEPAGPAMAPEGPAGSQGRRAEVLARQATGSSAAARQEAAASHDTPPAILAGLAGDANWHVRRKAAGNAGTPPGALEALAGDPQWHVRFAVAGNPRTPEHRLAGLASDERWEVRRAVASRWPVPAALLETLASDPYREVRCAVASRPAPPQALRILAEDPYRQVRREVAANPATPPDVLARLAADGAEGAAVSDDPHLADTSRLQAAIRGVSEQMKETVRQRVARNPSTPSEVLAGLLLDADPRVRACASAQLIWRSLTSVLKESLPPGMVLVDRPLIRRDERSVFMPDAAVVEQAGMPTSHTDRLAPEAVQLAVTIAWPSPEVAPFAEPSPHPMADVDYLWQIQLEAAPVISVYHRTGDTYIQTASARPGQPLTLDKPFSIHLDPADLMPPAPDRGA